MVHSVTIIPEQRQCKTCGTIKLLAEFGVHKASRGGRLAQCKSCISEQKRAYYLANRDAIRAKGAERYAADPDRHKARSQSYRSANRDRVLATNRVYRDAHPEQMRAYKANWYAKTRRLEGAPMADLTAVDWTDMVEHFDHRCAYCGRRTAQLQREHMVPLSRGGEHTSANIVPACAACNRQKSSMTPLEWMFLSEIDRYGLWTADLEAAAKAFNQLPLFADGAR